MSRTPAALGLSASASCHEIYLHALTDVPRIPLGSISLEMHLTALSLPAQSRSCTSVFGLPSRKKTYSHKNCPRTGKLLFFLSGRAEHNNQPDGNRPTQSIPPSQLGRPFPQQTTAPLCNHVLFHHLELLRPAQVLVVPFWSSTC